MTILIILGILIAAPLALIWSAHRFMSQVPDRPRPPLSRAQCQARHPASRGHDPLDEAMQLANGVVAEAERFCKEAAS